MNKIAVYDPLQTNPAKAALLLFVPRNTYEMHIENIVESIGMFRICQRPIVEYEISAASKCFDSACLIVEKSAEQQY